ncbi:MAG: outer membrane beta-barrel protein, partial [Parachlamydiaceae bacterium]|nr:outer membrane beta-barrel protein [Parachlamydiaceae bacterium]
AYVDFNLNCMFTPYIGAGIGYANIDIQVKHNDSDLHFSVSKHRNEFAYQGIVGVSAEICANTDCFVEYRYFDCTGKNKNAHIQNALVGLRRSF